VERTRKQACAALFRSKGEQIDGVIVTLPNFGDERPSPTPCGWRG